MTHLRTTASLLIALLFGVTAALLFPAGAHAATPNTCSGTETATYTPSLQVVAANTAVTADGSLTCTGDTTHSAADIQFQGTGMLSCLTGGTTQGTGQLHWTAPAASVSSFTFTLTIGARPVGQMVLIATGTITSGDYAGEPVLFTFTLLNTDPADCLGDGISSASGPLTVTIGV
jgi:hypothetical protein